MKQRSQDLDPFLGPFWDMGICNENGMLAHGFTHVYAYFVYINRCLGWIEVVVHICDVNVC
jgi:hypothetical protein